MGSTIRELSQSKRSHMQRWLLISRPFICNVWSILHICHFSSHTQCLVKFFSTQKPVNRDKTDFVTKVRKLRRNQFYNKRHEFYICEGILHITHTHTRCGDISDISTSYLSCGDRQINYPSRVCRWCANLEASLKMLWLRVLSNSKPTGQPLIQNIALMLLIIEAKPSLVFREGAW